MAAARTVQGLICLALLARVIAGRSSCSRLLVEEIADETFLMQVGPGLSSLRGRRGSVDNKRLASDGGSPVSDDAAEATLAETTGAADLGSPVSDDVTEAAVEIPCNAPLSEPTKAPELGSPVSDDAAEATLAETTGAADLGSPVSDDVAEATVKNPSTAALADTTGAAELGSRVSDSVAEATVENPSTAPLAETTGAADLGSRVSDSVAEATVENPSTAPLAETTGAADLGSSGISAIVEVVGSTGAMGIGEWTPVFYQKLVMCLSFNERSLFTLGIMVLVMAACIAAKLKDVMSGRISQTERSVTLQSRDPLCGERPH